MRKHCAFILYATAGLLTGCDSSALTSSDPRNEFVKPTIAVMKFENRAPAQMGWNLGDGTADILVDRLMASRRYHVIERPELASIQKELRLQNSGSTRVENKAALGRLKNVQYLIKGTITDFGHVATGTGFLGLPNVDLLGRTHQAIVTVTLYVVEVESGEIICSQTLSESVRTSDMNVKAYYKDIAFGGSAFYSTPLGKATTAILDKAVQKVTDTIANRPWQPKIAMVEPDGSVIVNGGADRLLAAGFEYDAIEAGAAIHDPDSGDVLGSKPGKVVGRLRIREVNDRFAVAQVVSGTSSQFQVGQRLTRVR